MASKLFHAVVGVGIALGSAAACDGSVEPSTPADAAASDAASADGTAAVDATSGDVSVPTDATTEVDATDDDVVDAGADVIADAAVDAAVDAPTDAAFCDNAWPTTKGTYVPPTCLDPAGACADAGPIARCLPTLAPHDCDTSTMGFAASCSGGADASVSDAGPGEWECPSGTIHVESCWCFGAAPMGKTCTDAGFQ